MALQSPSHRVKTDPDAGDATSVIEANSSVTRKQVLPQSRPAGSLVTRPRPLPILVTETKHGAAAQLSAGAAVGSRAELLGTATIAATATARTKNVLLKPLNKRRELSTPGLLEHQGSAHRPAGAGAQRRTRTPKT